jgi:hypothetical protein
VQDRALVGRKPVAMRAMMVLYTALIFAGLALYIVVGLTHN